MSKKLFIGFLTTAFLVSLPLLAHGLIRGHKLDPAIDITTTGTVSAEQLTTTDDATITDDLTVTGITNIGENLKVPDDIPITLGTNSDYTLEYEETTCDSLILQTTARNGSNDEQAMITFAVGSSSGAAFDANQEVFEIGKDAEDDAGANWVELFAVDEDGDVTIAGDCAVTGTITGTYSPSSYDTADDTLSKFGDDDDYSFEYDETGQDIFILATDAATTQNDDYAMITFAVNTSSGAGMDAEQEVFEVGKDGTDDSDAAFIELFAIDEDGDINVAAGTLSITDDKTIILGADSDYTLEYEETSADSLILQTSAANGSADDTAMITFAVNTSSAAIDADQEVFEIGKGGEDDSVAQFEELLAIDEDGDVTIKGDVTANSFSGSITSTSMDLADDTTANFGTSDEWKVEYADGDEDTLSIYTTKTSASGVDNAMVTVAADTGNSGCTSNQEIFEVGRGGQDDADGTFTELFAVDEDGDVTIAGTLTQTGVATFATHVELGDDDVLKLGATPDFELEWDDGTSDAITFTSPGTTATNDEDAIFTFAADNDSNASDDMDADQEVFEIGKGARQDGDADFTELFAVDEDGDCNIVATATVGTGLTLTAGTLQTNEDLDINISSSAAKILIDMTHTTGTASQSLIDVNDARTGGTADAMDEATLQLDANGVYSLYIEDGSVAIADDETVIFGTDANYTMEYEETSTDSMLLYTSATNGSHDDTAMITFAVDVGSTTFDANQQVFEVGKGGQTDTDTDFTELFSVDEDGDVVVANNINAGGTATFVGKTSVTTGALALYSRTEAELKALSPAAVGDIYYDSTNYAIVIATNTGAGDFGIIYDANNTAPTGW